MEKGDIPQQGGKVDILVDMVDSMEKIVIAQHRGKSRHSGAAGLLFSHCCAMSTFSTLLPHDFLFQAAAPCLLFPLCCPMSALLTMLHHVYYLYPRYEVHRGYIVFAFSVIMFVCLSVCLFVCL